MKGLYIINGLGFSHGVGIGGSDKRAIEVLRALKVAKLEQFDILTTYSGKKIFLKDEKLDVLYLTITKPFFWPETINHYLFGRVLSYFYALLVSGWIILRKNTYNFYFATSDFFFDLIPGFLGKAVHKKKLICMVHHYIRSPKERSGGFLINFLMYFSQRFSFWFITKTADALFLYDTDEGKKIHQVFLTSGYKRKVFFVKNGINTKLIDKAEKKETLYDACFVGGLRLSKGINEFVPIWEQVLKFKSDAKLIILGGGSKELVDQLKFQIKEAALQNHIILAGPLSGTALFEKVKASKLFLFPSHEEGWGIALCEAMYCLLPVVCYDLPAFTVFGNVLIKCRVGDFDCLAQNTIELLKKDAKRVEIGKTLNVIAAEYTWEKIALYDLECIKSVL
ncbi:MAG: glycosyltransferase [Patescibacteria group bacterium]